MVFFFVFLSRAQSPKSHHGETLFMERQTQPPDDSQSVSPSAHSSDERPRSRATSHPSRPHSQPSRSGL